MESTPQTSTLEQWLPDAVVISDVKRIVHADAGQQVGLDSGTISIPSVCDYEIVSKSFIEQRFEVGFGNCFRVVVAIGGVSSNTSVLVEPKYCSCTLWYSEDRRLITTDLSKEIQM